MIFAGFPVDSSLQVLDIKNSINSCEFRSGPPSSSKLDVRTSDTIIVEYRRLKKSSNDPIVPKQLSFLPKSLFRFSWITFLIRRACVRRGDIIAIWLRSPS